MSYMENSVDPDQLAKASTLFSIEFIVYIWFHMVFKKIIYGLSNRRAKLSRPPDKSAYWKIIFFISHPKHMLWVLKRTVSMRRFF